jgi:hypothetical protein
LARIKNRQRQINCLKLFYNIESSRFGLAVRQFPEIGTALLAPAERAVLASRELAPELVNRLAAEQVIMGMAEASGEAAELLRGQRWT